MDRLIPRFGLALPAFASPGAALFRTPGFLEVDPAFCLALAKRADADGFDSLWVPDHLMIGRESAVLEGWTLLSAVAAVTQRVLLGLIQQSNLFRHPAVLAKAAATLDQISGGRFTLFYNYGTKREETSAFGLDFPDDELERVARAAEAIELITALWTADGPIDREGQFYQLAGARARPTPLCKPPIWFAGTQPQNLQLLAQYGGGWCTQPATLAEVAEKLDHLDKALATAGRTRDGMEITLETQILVAESTGELRSRLAQLVALDPSGALSGRAPLEADELDDFIAGLSNELPPTLAGKWIVGTPDSVTERIAAYCDAGITHFIFWFMDLPDERGLSLFRERVRPRFPSADEPDKEITK